MKITHSKLRKTVRSKPHHEPKKKVLKKKKTIPYPQQIATFAAPRPKVTPDDALRKTWKKAEAESLFDPKKQTGHTYHQLASEPPQRVPTHVLQVPKDPNTLSDPFLQDIMSTAPVGQQPYLTKASQLKPDEFVPTTAAFRQGAVINLAKRKVLPALHRQNTVGSILLESSDQAHPREESFARGQWDEDAKHQHLSEKTHGILSKDEIFALTQAVSKSPYGGPRDPSEVNLARGSPFCEHILHLYPVTDFSGGIPPFTDEELMTFFRRRPRYLNFVTENNPHGFDLCVLHRMAFMNPDERTRFVKQELRHRVWQLLSHREQNRSPQMNTRMKVHRTFNPRASVFKIKPSARLNKELLSPVATKKPTDYVKTKDQIAKDLVVQGLQSKLQEAFVGIAAKLEANGVPKRQISKLYKIVSERRRSPRRGLLALEKILALLGQYGQAQATALAEIKAKEAALLAEADAQGEKIDDIQMIAPGVELGLTVNVNDDINNNINDDQIIYEYENNNNNNNNTQNDSNNNNDGDGEQQPKPKKRGRPPKQSALPDIDPESTKRAVSEFIEIFREMRQLSGEADDHHTRAAKVQPVLLGVLANLGDPDRLVKAKLHASALRTQLDPETGDAIYHLIDDPLKIEPPTLIPITTVNGLVRNDVLLQDLLQKDKGQEQGKEKEKEKEKGKRGRKPKAGLNAEEQQHHDEQDGYNNNNNIDGNNNNNDSSNDYYESSLDNENLSQQQTTTPSTDDDGNDPTTTDPNKPRVKRTRALRFQNRHGVMLALRNKIQSTKLTEADYEYLKRLEAANPNAYQVLLQKFGPALTNSDPEAHQHFKQRLKLLLHTDVGTLDDDDLLDLDDILPDGDETGFGKKRRWGAGLPPVQVFPPEEGYGPGNVVESIPGQLMEGAYHIVHRTDPHSLSSIPAKQPHMGRLFLSMGIPVPVELEVDETTGLVVGKERPLEPLVPIKTTAHLTQYYQNKQKNEGNNEDGDNNTNNPDGTKSELSYNDEDNDTTTKAIPSYKLLTPVDTSEDKKKFTVQMYDPSSFAQVNDLKFPKQQQQQQQNTTTPTPPPQIPLKTYRAPTAYEAMLSRIAATPDEEEQQQQKIDGKRNQRRRVQAEKEAEAEKKADAEKKAELDGMYLNPDAPTPTTKEPKKKTMKQKQKEADAQMAIERHKDAIEEQQWQEQQQEQQRIEKIIKYKEQEEGTIKEKKKGKLAKVKDTPTETPTTTIKPKTTRAKKQSTIIDTPVDASVDGVVSSAVETTTSATTPPSPSTETKTTKEKATKVTKEKITKQKTTQQLDIKPEEVVNQTNITPVVADDDQEIKLEQPKQQESISTSQTTAQSTPPSAVISPSNSNTTTNNNTNNNNNTTTNNNNNATKNKNTTTKANTPQNVDDGEYIFKRNRNGRLVRVPKPKPSASTSYEFNLGPLAQFATRGVIDSPLVNNHESNNVTSQIGVLDSNIPSGNNDSNNKM